MAKQVIKRKVAMAAVRADGANGHPSIHSIKYRKLDGRIGYKARVSKNMRHLPGTSKFRGSLNEGHEFLFRNHDAIGTENEHFRIKIDLLIEVDGHTIDHTNGEYATARQ